MKTGHVRVCDWRWILLIILLCGLHAVGGGTAQANGAPVTVYLSYLPEVSNWGPTTATGFAIVAVGDGEITLEIHGLPRLSNEHYSAWLESKEERQLYLIGKFNTAEDGLARLNVLLDTLPYQEYRMLLITVETEPDPSPEPSDRRAIAGYFPNLAVIQITDQATVTPGISRPAYLPVTGVHLASGVWVLGLAGPCLAGIAVFVSWLISRPGPTGPVRPWKSDHERGDNL